MSPASNRLFAHRIQAPSAVDSRSVEFIASIDLGKIDFSNQVYTDYAPFKPVVEGFYCDRSFLFVKKLQRYTDTIGFVLETFFLPTDIKLEEALISGPLDIERDILSKYNKYRIKRYFKPFDDVMPRKIWGCDSPIELFILQGLAQKDIFPNIQTLIFNNGQVYDNYYQMIEDKIFIKGDGLVTEADFYLPDKKIAIFCDSVKYHRNKSDKEKDKKISDKLKELGIKSVRLNGKDIVNNLEKCVNKVMEQIA